MSPLLLSVNAPPIVPYLSSTRAFLAVKESTCQCKDFEYRELFSLEAARVLRVSMENSWRAYPTPWKLEDNRPNFRTKILVEIILSKKQAKI